VISKFPELVTFEDEILNNKNIYLKSFKLYT